MSNNFRSQFKATPIKQLKKAVDEDNDLIGASNNEYLNLEDGKTLKIRIFPAHPGAANFYVAKKCYWLSVTNNDGDVKRTTVLDSVAHGGTKMDICDEYIKFGKKKWAGDSEKMECFVGEKDALKPQFSWTCYADTVEEGKELRAKFWEMKKMVRDGLNKLAFSEDEEEPIQVDPFTDCDEGLPVMVKYMKKPNRKKGENYYEVSFPKKSVARPLTDAELEHFSKLKPLNEVFSSYGIKDFEKALEGLQNFDETNNLDLFEDDEWLAIVEEIRSQYDDSNSTDEDEQPKKKTTSKPVETKKKPVTKVEEPEPEEPEVEEPEQNLEPEEDGFDDMSRNDLKIYIRDNGLEVKVYQSMSDDDIRDAIRAAIESMPEPEEPEVEEPEVEEPEVEEPKPKSKLTLDELQKKLRSGKK